MTSMMIQQETVFRKVSCVEGGEGDGEGGWCGPCGQMFVNKHNDKHHYATN